MLRLKAGGAACCDRRFRSWAVSTSNDAYQAPRRPSVKRPPVSSACRNAAMTMVAPGPCTISLSGQKRKPGAREPLGRSLVADSPKGRPWPALPCRQQGRRTRQLAGSGWRSGDGWFRIERARASRGHFIPRHAVDVAAHRIEIVHAAVEGAFQGRLAAERQIAVRAGEPARGARFVREQEFQSLMDAEKPTKYVQADRGSACPPSRSASCDRSA